MIFTTDYNSPVGILQLSSDEHRLIGLNFTDKATSIDAGLPLILKNTIRELDEYFAGKRYEFDIPLQMDGSEFQKSVWRQLQKVGYGQTVSYKDIAQGIGNPRAMRAVGLANNRNPVAIIAPCHRVIGSGGKMVGYGGGLWRKEWLLDHERKNKI
jgi:O-6-methylguanine DNA methyltransferase